MTEAREQPPPLVPVSGTLRSRSSAFLPTLRADAELVVPELREWWSNYLSSHTPHFLNLLELLEGVSARRVLDVGNFPGQFTLLLAHLGYETEGLDLAPERAGGLWHKHGVPVHRVDVEKDEFPVEPGSFDVVVLAEVLEHLRVDPLHTLRQCHRALRPGGHLIASVPNVSPRHRIRFLLGRDYQGDILEEYESLETVGHMGHFRLYSRREVVRMLEYVGLEPRELRVAGWLPAGRWSFVRLFGPLRNRFRSHLYAVAQRAS